MTTTVAEIDQLKFLGHTVSIYGTHQSPLFNATHVATMLGMKNHRSTTKNYGDDDCYVIRVRGRRTSYNATVLTLAALKRLVASRNQTALTTNILQWIQSTADDIAVKQSPCNESSIQQQAIQLDELEAVCNRISDLENELKQRDVAIEQKNSELSISNEQNILLKNELHHQSEQLTHKDEQIATLNETINQLKADMQREIEQREVEKMNDRAQHDQLTLQLERSTTESDELKLQLEEQIKQQILTSEHARWFLDRVLLGDKQYKELLGGMLSLLAQWKDTLNER